MDALQPGDPAAVGGYRLLGRLGSGGMGQVYLGTSPSGRKVAVKLIKPEYAQSPHFRERFTREVEAARRVGGFHTAAVVDADPDAVPPWMVTAYIQGQSLQEAVNADGPFAPDALRALGAGLAEGLGAIHACGLVHRDLKPANVIMAEDGPRIIDFGIARVTDVSALTTTGSVVGTVTFMSPEQVRGEPIGPASDVFSLGCVLAFTATGRVPFDGETIVTVMHKIMYEAPDLAGMPSDGEFGALLTQCLAKAPEDRPPLRELLTRFTREPVMPVGVPASTRRDVARPPAQSRRHAPTQDAPRTAEAAPGTTEQVARVRSPRRRRLAVIAVAALLAAGLAASLPVLLSGRHTTRGKTPATAHGGGSSRAPASRAPQAEPQPEFELADPSGGRLINVAFQPHGSLLAGTDGDGRTYLWDGTSGQLAAALDDPGGKAVPGIAFTPDGTEIVTGDLNGSAYLWRVNGGARVVTYSAAGSRGVTDVGIFGNGRLLAAGDTNGTVHFWDVATGKFFMSPAEPGGRPVLAVAFSPVAAILASTDPSHTVYLWKLSSTATPYAAFPDTSASPADPGHGGVAFSPDGTWLATADQYNTYVWDVSGRTRLRVLPDLATGCGRCVLNVAFSPDGRLLATSMTSGGAQAGSPLAGRIYLWDTTTWTLLRTWPEPASTVNGYIAPGIAFSSDGTQLATADGSGHAYIWKLIDIIAADKL